MTSTPTPIPPRAVHVFALQALAFTLLIGLWPTPKQFFPGVFHAHANGVFSLRSERPMVLAEVEPSPRNESDTEMQGFEADRALWLARFSVNRVGYWPLAALLGMCLATPMRWPRRLLAIGLGVALLDAFTLGRIAVAAEYAFQEAAQEALGSTPSFAHLLLRVGSESLTATVPSMAGVFVIWALVARPTHTLEIGPARRFFAAARTKQGGL